MSNASGTGPVYARRSGLLPRGRRRRTVVRFSRVAKHIGIVTASPEGAALFYRQVFRQASHILGADEPLRVSLHNEPLSLYIDAIRKDDWHAVGELLRRSAQFLHRCGAEFCLSPDNAVQHGVHLAESGSPIPWLTMPDLVAKAVAADNRKTVGLIGT